MTNNPFQRIYNQSGAIIGRTTLPDDMPLANGFLRFFNVSYPRITHHFEVNADEPKPTDLFVAGTVSKEYEEIERTKIFGDNSSRNVLPARVGAYHELPLFQVNETMLRHAEKYYSPNVALEDRLLVTDKHSLLYCLGKVAIVLDSAV